MKLDMFVVDAFTHERFKGNPAAVVLLTDWLAAACMQNIAAENNLSETAFIKQVAGNTYDIRWFSPNTEIDFCGHATLAASFVLFSEFGVTGELCFQTQDVGNLIVSSSDGRMFDMSFPNQQPGLLATAPQALLQGLSIKPKEVLRNRQAYFAVMASEDDVKAVSYERSEIEKLAPFDVVVTARSDNHDFVSRYFWPANGGDEDPVTGSIHAGLAPYWADKLNKRQLTAYQASPRGGLLYCRVNGERVMVSGEAVLYLRGQIDIDSVHEQEEAR
ncbi:PhzF family phenazine biosynthesis protein [Neiella marina]|uniref:PhzF family phenazine biosynthesis protein n=1 Tax=Neiella holothuriorum TaxID=2870530 RepID=A0ABS7ECM9_9GAMM|nr:PhzF family phenazine biosynthesis protein [Neiella holothuriorum]MBW8190092.1 PhzF family phenazine biosynthesis protein [Neiella holothuriorum]